MTRDRIKEFSVAVVCGLLLGAALIFALTACTTTGGFLGTGAPAPPPEPQPYGFEYVHFVVLAIGAMMAVGGIVLTLVVKDVKMGGGLLVAGVCTMALAWAAGYYGREVALGSAIVLGVGAALFFGQMIWMRVKEIRRDSSFKEVVKKGNGHIDALDLTDMARSTVERAKKAIAKETK